MPFNQLAYKLINMMPFNGYENYITYWLTMYTFSMWISEVSDQ